MPLSFLLRGCRPEQGFHRAVEGQGDADCRPHPGLAFVVLYVLVLSFAYPCFLSDLRLCLAGLLARRPQCEIELRRMLLRRGP